MEGQSAAIIHYRDDETMYVEAKADRVTVVFSTIFKDEDDIVLGKVFLQVRSSVSRHFIDSAFRRTKKHKYFRWCEAFATTLPLMENCRVTPFLLTCWVLRRNSQGRRKMINKGICFLCFEGTKVVWINLFIGIHIWKRWKNNYKHVIKNLKNFFNSYILNCLPYRIIYIGDISETAGNSNTWIYFPLSPWAIWWPR